MKFKSRILFVAVLIFFSACEIAPVKKDVDFFSTDLFRDVQLQAVFPDSKSFADCSYKKPLAEIIGNYEAEKNSHVFNLKKFVSENFELPQRPHSDFTSDTSLTMEAHITRLWPVLQRSADKHITNSSLIPLPHPYIVPGGRFSEIYYWDSYFTMLGLQAQGRYDMIENMINNFSFLIDSLGFIPNGNRTYYLSRSQPPFFSLMIKILEDKDSLAAVHYLPELEKEYAFWMHGLDKLQKAGDAVEHVVRLNDGTTLNRYFDKVAEPRPEAYKEDYKLAQQSKQEPKALYTNLRAAGESGIDFSNRWFRQGEGMESIHTTDFIAVDLNALLYHLEMMIAHGHALQNDQPHADHFISLADARKKALLKFCWDADKKFFFDYDFKAQQLSTVKTMAAVYPLFFHLAESSQAKDVARILETEFLKQGGLLYTLTASGQQWDAPNGWAPMQWLAYKGLKNYKIDAPAKDIKTRWLKLNERVYKTTGKMMEKYNVVDDPLNGGGGEYANQDGFGWTNGIAIKFIKSE